MSETASSKLYKQLLSGARIVFPETAGDDERRIDASWLRDAALRGVSIDVSNALISGLADFRALRFEGDVRVIDTKFEDFVDLSYAEFQRTANFSGSAFSQGVSFDSTQFRSDVWLARASFGTRDDSGESRVIFNDADFGGVLDAQEVRFKDDAVASFARTRFRTSVFFVSSRFGGPADFSQAQIDGALEFAGTLFRGAFKGDHMRVGHYLGLSNTRFKKTAPVSLREIEVVGSLYCNDARFGSSLDLSESRINSSFHAVNTCFLGSTNFSRVLISGLANFRAARFGRRAPAYFSSVSASGDVDLSAALLKNKADFTDLTTTSSFIARDTRFLGATSFRRISVARSVQLSGSRFEYVSLQNARIVGLIDCTGVVFRGPVTGRDARLGTFIFNGQAHAEFDFYGVHLKGALILTGARFRGRPDALDIAGVDVGTQAYFDGACFHGKLNAIGLNIEQQFSFNRVVCGEEVDFYELTVKRGFFLWESRFRRSFKLNSANIGGELYLSGARFRGHASFDTSAIRAVYMHADEDHGNRATDFRRGVSFARARLGYLGFRGVHCYSQDMSGDFRHMAVAGVGYFSDAQFQGKVSFYSCTFGGEAIFQRVHFEGLEDVDLRGTVFQKNVYFAPTVFAAGADFTNAQFMDQAMFRAHFSGRATFDSCRFRGVADFCDSELMTSDEGLTDTWSLEPSSPMPRGTVFQSASFAHADFAADARFQNVLFGTHLDLRTSKFVSLFLPTGPTEHAHRRLPDAADLRGCTYKQISAAARPLLIKESGEERLEPYDRQPYNELEQAIRRSGDDNGGNEVHLLWRRAERRQHFKRRYMLSWVLSWVYRVVANYGIRPYRLAAVSAVLIAAGTLYFQQPGTMKPKEASKETNAAHTVTVGEAFGMSLRQFLPISIALGEELIPTSCAVKWDLRWSERGMTIQTTPSAVATILKICGWILVPLGIGSLTGVLRRLPGR